MDKSKEFKFEEPMIKFEHHGSFSTERNDIAPKSIKPNSQMMKHFQSYAITPKHLATPVGFTSNV